MRILAAFLCVFLVVPALVYASSDCSPASEIPLSVYNLVAFGSAQDKVYLATPYGNTFFHNPAKWRLRTIVLPPDVRPCEPDAVSLAPTGTKMLVSCPEKPPIIIDLTAQVVSNDPRQHQHRLAYVSETSVLFFRRTSGDITPKGIQVYRLEAFEASASPKGANVPSGPEPSFTLPEATHAIQLASGKVAYITGSGAVRIRDLSGNDSEVGNLSPALADGDVLLATGREGTHGDGFVLTTGDKAYYYTTDGTAEGTKQIHQDVGLFEILKTLQDWRKTPDLDKPPKYCGNKKGQLKSIVCVDPAHLKEGKAEIKVRWRGITLVQPLEKLYAPVLEFAREETVYPTNVCLWPSKNDLNDNLCKDVPPKELRNCLYERWYLPKHIRPWENSSVYYQILSCRGTWLYEYWTYYPIDVGGVEGHLHDPEHVFVEVDKLGGRPDAVLASAHSNITPNNIYSRIGRAGASPIPLPIVVMVELGKHASAPDINQDGYFTPGIDTNVNAEQAQVWGIRDAIGISDSHMTKYEGSMTLPRRKEDRLPPPCFKCIFPKAVSEGFLGKGHGDRHYALEPFPSQETVCVDRKPAPPPDEAAKSSTENALLAVRLNRCPDENRQLTARPQQGDPCKTLWRSWYYLSKEDSPGRECALNSLISHSDSNNPRAIYKKHVFPSWGLRGGYSGIAAGHGISGTLVLSLPENLPLLGVMSLPGRIAVDFQRLWGLRSGQLDGTGRVNWAATVGATYERHLTNLFGYYLGPLCRFDWTDRGSQFGGWWGRAGIMIEARFLRELGALNVQVGPIFSGRLAKAIGFEIRVSRYVYSAQNRFRFGRWRPFYKPVKEY